VRQENGHAHAATDRKWNGKPVFPSQVPRAVNWLTEKTIRVDSCFVV